MPEQGLSAVTRDDEAPQSGEHQVVRYVAPSAAHDALVRAANDLLLASDNLNEYDEQGERVAGEMAHLVGGLHSAVYAISDLLTKPAPHAASNTGDRSDG